MKPFLDLKYQKELFVNLISDIEGKEEILDALNFAEKAHKGQKRDSGAEYVIHLIRTASILIKEFSIKEKEMIIAALLQASKDSMIQLSATRESETMLQ